MEISLELVEKEEAEFNQICYMSVELMLKLGANIRSCIQINTGNEEILCVVYPKHGLAENVIMYSKSVQKSDTIVKELSVKDSMNNAKGTKQIDVRNMSTGKKALLTFIISVTHHVK